MRKTINDFYSDEYYRIHVILFVFFAGFALGMFITHAPEVVEVTILAPTPATSSQTQYRSDGISSTRYDLLEWTLDEFPELKPFAKELAADGFTNDDYELVKKAEAAIKQKRIFGN